MDRRSRRARAADEMSELLVRSKECWKLERWREEGWKEWRRLEPSSRWAIGGFHMAGLVALDGGGGGCGIGTLREERD